MVLINTPIIDTRRVLRARETTARGVYITPDYHQTEHYFSPQLHPPSPSPTPRIKGGQYLYLISQSTPPPLSRACIFKNIPLFSFSQGF
jgi:hypothetical protein